MVASSVLVKGRSCWSMHSLHSYHQGYSVHGSIEQELVWLGKEADWYPQWHYFVYLSLRIFYAVGALFNIYMGQKYLHILCPFWDPFTYFFPILVTDLPILFSQIPNHSAKTLASPINQYSSSLQPVLTPDVVDNQCTLWNTFLPPMRIFLHHSLSVLYSFLSVLTALENIPTHIPQVSANTW